MGAVGCTTQPHPTALAAPELRPLFDDWLATVEEELLAHLAEDEPTDLTAIANHLGLAPVTTAHLLGRMAAAGKISLYARPAPAKREEPHNGS